MKRHLIVFSALLVLGACTAKKQQFTNNQTSTTATATVKADGSSYEKAIVINASGEIQGIKAEYDWLKQNYPGYKMKQQTSGSYKNKQYDMMQITTAEGAAMTVYFDITSFFGKF